MTTSELIKLLQAVDPEGTTPGCVDNDDIHHVVRVEAYYDGRLEQFDRDADGRVVSARLTGSGEKVRIYHRSIMELFIDRPDLPVSCESRYREMVEGWRAEARQIAVGTVDG